ncbi:hypothetical protein CEW87_18305 [Parazoarcus communis]|uniref:DUF4062 domain-containing protein n=1 Tax=Parazoarcus communis TaxID=41977 RepID=A0A2U8H657_9RHOO|nr:DUF4062 domain-containing protein [Parazoarcus communis]AWI81143.1 hypothetical protein CEW87_18305 [Parazoarcus communis]
MPSDADIAEISQIFLSATAKDCKAYRESVRDFVQSNLPAAKIYLQEDWSEGGHFVVDVCKARVTESDGYFGLFGFRYGWIPPGFQYSITELEFRWAEAKWGNGEAPVFILLPEAGSPAEKHLREAAKAQTDLDPPDLAALDNANQTRFLQTVKEWAADGRIMVFYRDQVELLGKALSSIQNWNLTLLRQALAGRRQASGDIPLAELGRIGRDTQRMALVDALEDFRSVKGERAAAFLVHGPENHGQREFAEFLNVWDDEWEDAQPICGQPADTADALIRWTCGQLGTPMIERAALPELAQTLAARLRRGPVIIIQRSIGHRPERLTRFIESFWRPLRKALATQDCGSGRLYWFLIDHSPLPQAGLEAVLRMDENDTHADYDDLLALPALDDISAGAVRKWLKELRKSAGIKLGEAQRDEIAALATTPNGNPSDVYNRLTLHGFWASAS